MKLTLSKQEIDRIVLQALINRGFKVKERTISPILEGHGCDEDDTFEGYSVEIEETHEKS